MNKVIMPNGLIVESGENLERVYDMISILTKQGLVSENSITPEKTVKGTQVDTSKLDKEIVSLKEQVTNLEEEALGIKEYYSGIMAESNKQVGEKDKFYQSQIDGLKLELDKKQIQLDLLAESEDKKNVKLNETIEQLKETKSALVSKTKELENFKKTLEEPRKIITMTEAKVEPTSSVEPKIVTLDELLEEPTPVVTPTPTVKDRGLMAKFGNPEDFDPMTPELTETLHSYLMGETVTTKLGHTLNAYDLQNEIKAEEEVIVPIPVVVEEKKIVVPVINKIEPVLEKIVLPSPAPVKLNSFEAYVASINASKAKRAEQPIVVPVPKPIVIDPKIHEIEVKYGIADIKVEEVTHDWIDAQIDASQNDRGRLEALFVKFGDRYSELKKLRREESEALSNPEVIVEQPKPIIVEEVQTVVNREYTKDSRYVEGGRNVHLHTQAFQLDDSHRLEIRDGLLLYVGVDGFVYRINDLPTTYHNRYFMNIGMKTAKQVWEAHLEEVQREKQNALFNPPIGDTMDYHWENGEEHLV
ncbi:MAG: hypothetical protein ACRC6E_14420 [Fusobacteriaceae bacterium]